MADLGVPAGYASVQGSGINASGQVVGYMSSAYAVCASAISAVPNGTTGSFLALDAWAGNWAQGINAAGDAVGAENSVDYEYASAPKLWEAASGGYPLPLLPWAYDGVALALNDSRWVVGYNANYYDYYSQVAVVWDAAGEPRDLNALTAQPTPGPLEEATGINAAGQIAANTPGVSAYLLTPSPVPAAPQYLQGVLDGAQVSLYWSAASGADYYTVRRAAASGGPYTVIASVSDTDVRGPGRRRLLRRHRRERLWERAPIPTKHGPCRCPPPLPASLPRPESCRSPSRGTPATWQKATRSCAAPGAAAPTTGWAG